MLWECKSLSIITKRNCGTREVDVIKNLRDLIGFVWSEMFLTMVNFLLSMHIDPECNPETTSGLALFDYDCLLQ